MLRYVTGRKFAAESGYTEDAIRAKFKSGVWLGGQVRIKAPDGRNLLDVQAMGRGSAAALVQPLTNYASQRAC